MNYPKELKERAPALVGIALKRYPEWGRYCFEYAIEYNRRTKKPLSHLKQALADYSSGVIPTGDLLRELAELAPLQAKYTGGKVPRAWLVWMLKDEHDPQLMRLVLDVFDAQQRAETSLAPHDSTPSPVEAEVGTNLLRWAQAHHLQVPPAVDPHQEVKQLNGLRVTPLPFTPEVWHLQMRGSHVVGLEGHSRTVCCLNFDTAAMEHEDLEEDPLGSGLMVHRQLFPVKGKAVQVLETTPLVYIAVVHRLVLFLLNLPPLVSVEVCNHTPSLFPSDWAVPAENHTRMTRYFPLHISQQTA